jgi:hypothetical protein
VADRDRVVSHERCRDAEQARRRSIIEDARATVERLQRESASWDVRSQLPPVEDKLTRWRREALEREAEQRRARMQTTDELNAQRSRDWERWADARIAAALAEHDRVTIEGTGQALAEIRSQLREEMQAAIDELRTELAVQRAHDAGRIIDLPMLPLRPRRTDAA